MPICMTTPIIGRYPIANLIIGATLVSTYCIHVLFPRIVSTYCLHILFPCSVSTYCFHVLLFPRIASMYCFQVSFPHIKYLHVCLCCAIFTLAVFILKLLNSLPHTLVLPTVPVPTLTVSSPTSSSISAKAEVDYYAQFGETNPIKGFRFEYQQTGDDTWHYEVPSTSLSSYTYTITGLEPYTEYSIKTSMILTGAEQLRSFSAPMTLRTKQASA